MIRVCKRRRSTLAIRILALALWESFHSAAQSVSWRAIALLTPLCASMLDAQQPKLLERIDHLVYATPSLDRGIKEVEDLLGVRAAAGGQHPGRGTRNALVALGPNTYLEIIAPDPDQPTPASPRAFGLDTLTRSRLVTWAAKTTNVDSIHAHALGSGISLGRADAGSRKRPDGVLLSWHFTNSTTLVGDGVVPFFIDWGGSPHPARTAPGGATLVALRAEHPDERRVESMLESLGLALPVTHGAHPALVATIAGRKGRAELR